MTLDLDDYQPLSETAVGPPQGTTGLLARFVLETDFEELSAEVVRATQRIILDTVACAVGASRTEAGRIVVELKEELGGRPDATLMTRGRKVPCTSAAYVHAQLANLLDADETLLNWGHFASVIVMPALAVGEMVRATGSEIVAAVAIGFEVAARVGLSFPDYEISASGDVGLAGHRGFSWAAFGTAATTGRLLGLDLQQIGHAFGLAFVHTPVHGCLSMCTKTATADSAWHKYAMYGAIAEAGVTSALLAQKGFHGVTTLFDDGTEFWKAFGADSCDSSEITSGLGSRWYIAETSIKPYPFCRFGHGALDLFSAIVADERLYPDDIDAIMLTLPPLHVFHMLAGTKTVESPFNVMNSLPYALALLAAGVPPGPKWVDRCNVESEDHRKFGEKVQYAIDEVGAGAFIDQVRVEGKFTRIPITVEIMSGTRHFIRSCEYARGDPFGPSAMTEAQLATKVREFADGVLSPAAIEALIVGVSNLESAPDVGVLTRALGSARV